MKKRFTLILASMLLTMGVWAQITVSTSVDTPETTYSLLSKNGAYMSAGTGATQFRLGRFAFYTATGENAYKIYSVDAKKWVSYTAADSYSAGANKAALVDNQENAAAWNVVVNANNADYYNIAPYKTDGTVASMYWNFHGGAGTSGKTYIYDDSKTVGFYDEINDGGSMWKLEKLTLATEEEVSAARDLVVVGPGYPKATSSVYAAMNALAYGTSTTKHVELAKATYTITNDIQLPENGKAYTFASVMGEAAGATKYYMKYVNGEKVSVSTTEGDASVFVCKELRSGVYAFITSDGKILTWDGNNEGGAYAEDGNIYGYSSNYATEFNGKSDWNEITVKKNGTAAKDLGYLRLVGRRHSTAFSSFIANKNNRFDQANDGYWFNSDNSSAWILTEVTHTNTDAQTLALAKIDAKVSVAAKVPGTLMGQYAYTIEDRTVTALSDVNSAVDAAVSVDAVNAIKNSAQLNLPEAGKFYAFKNDDYYITSSTIATGNRNIALNTTKDATAIYYYDGSHLLAYTTGLYIGLDGTDWGFEAIGSNNVSVIEFIAAANGAVAKYNIKSGGRWLHRTDAYVNRCSSNTCGNAHNWTIEEVTELPVAIGTVGYATLHAPVALTIPAGVKAYTGALNGEWLTLNEVSTTIPANTAVILEGAANTYNFAMTDDVDAIVGNKLDGTIETVAKTVTVYTLQSHDFDGDEVKEGVAFKQYTGTNLTGFKAYLVVESQAPAIRIRKAGDEETTSIEPSTLNPQPSTVIYDLQGRRVEKMEKGIYIVNGKKIIK